MIKIQNDTTPRATANQETPRPPSGGLYKGPRKTPLRYNFIVKNKEEDTYSMISSSESPSPPPHAEIVAEEVDELEEGDIPSARQ